LLLSFSFFPFYDFIFLPIFKNFYVNDAFELTKLKENSHKIIKRIIFL